MTCHELRESLVERGRDVVLDAAMSAALDRHLEHCGDCAAQLARQRALTVALRAVARSSSNDAAPAALKAHLLEMFVAQQPEQKQMAAGVPSGRAARRRWLAVAAAGLIVAGASYGWWMVQVRPKPGATTAQVRLKPGAPNVELPKGPSRPVATRPRPSLRIEDFVALPAATGLPPFESGRIVRVDLPVSALPAYGVELVPDAARTEVQADVLVGQDGQARAIRLVNGSRQAGTSRPRP